VSVSLTLTFNLNFLWPGCGGILTAQTGVISYKATTNYENNERCVWTVAVPGALQYDFVVDKYSALDLNDGIYITQILRTPSAEFDPTINTQRL